MTLSRKLTISALTLFALIVGLQALDRFVAPGSFTAWSRQQRQLSGVRWHRWALQALHAAPCGAARLAFTTADLTSRASDCGNPSLDFASSHSV